jgi:HK97 family phage major capsid protein
MPAKIGLLSAPLCLCGEKGLILMTDKQLKLQEKRAALIKEMREIGESDNFTLESQKRHGELNTQQKLLKTQIEACAAQEALDAEMREVTPPPQPQPGAGAGNGTTADPALRENATENERRLAEMPESMRRSFTIASSREYRGEFVRWARTGQVSAKLDGFQSELRAYSGLNVGTGSQGEYTIPVGFQRELEITMKAYGGMRRNARIVPTNTGNALHWPVTDDTANQGRWLAEAAGVAQTNPTFSEVVYNAYLASSDQVLVSVQLLQDSAFDLEALLAQLLGIRLGRLTEAGYTTGTGTTQPTGIVTAINNDASPNTVTAAGSSANDGTGATGSNSIGSDDFESLISAVDPSYRVGAKFMAHWSILDYLRKVKDKYGRPLFTDPTTGELKKIMGYELDWNAAMAPAVNGVPAAATDTVVFGKFNEYIIRDVLGMTMVRYNEMYMPNHQVGFQAYLRTDGERLQAKAFSMLVQHP